MIIVHPESLDKHYFFLTKGSFSLKSFTSHIKASPVQGWLYFCFPRITRNFNSEAELDAFVKSFEVMDLYLDDKLNLEPRFLGKVTPKITLTSCFMEIRKPRIGQGFREIVLADIHLQANLDVLIEPPWNVYMKPVWEAEAEKRKLKEQLEIDEFYSQRIKQKQENRK
jgi:hypothetical protein